MKILGSLIVAGVLIWLFVVTFSFLWWLWLLLVGCALVWWANVRKEDKEHEELVRGIKESQGAEK